MNTLISSSFIIRGQDTFKSNSDNINQDLLSACYMPGIVLSTLHELSHKNLHDSPMWKTIYYLHFIDNEAKTLTCSGYISLEMVKPDFNPDTLIPGLTVLTIWQFCRVKALKANLFWVRKGWEKIQRNGNILVSSESMHNVLTYVKGKNGYLSDTFIFTKYWRFFHSHMLGISPRCF